MGAWECMKLGELPWHNTLGVLCWGRSLKIQVEIKKGRCSCWKWKKTRCYWGQVVTWFLHFVKIQIRNAFNGMLECLEVGHIQFMTDLLCSISKLGCPLPLPSPQQPTNAFRGISIYLWSLSKGAHVQTNANFLNGKCSSCGMRNNG
jgi:hypothetical protein